MHVLTQDREKIELELLPAPSIDEVIAAPSGIGGAVAEASPLVHASRAVFRLGLQRGPVARRVRERGAPPAVFRERATGLTRVVYREIVMRFQADVAEKVQRAAIKKHGLEIRRRNLTVPNQLVLVDRTRRRAGTELLEIVNDFAEMQEVVFATPNFVSEFRRDRTRANPPTTQWHLRNLGTVSGQKRNEDVRALPAWKTTRGKPSIVIAILDDGVDVDHPDLKSRIAINQNKSDPDRVGRDFFLPDDDPDHFNPRPKKFRSPFDQMSGNDIHGTPCAGVAAAAGIRALGAAPGSRILPVKVFHADELAQDERVADAIRYAATNADIVSCSWSCGRSPDVELAIEDAGGLGRGGLGAAVFCATGNDEHDPVSYPAADPKAIAVGASTDQGRLAWYSNVGPEVDFVAPSSGGKEGIFTTDVSYAGRGFNVGDANRGGTDGLYTNEFGGTSSATPLAAGIGALVLAVNPSLTRDALRSVLGETADRIGRGYDRTGHSDEFGFGRLNAERAVEAAKQ
jgi:subtilisin family serine protease